MKTNKITAAILAATLTATALTATAFADAPYNLVGTEWSDGDTTYTFTSDTEGFSYSATYDYTSNFYWCYSEKDGMYLFNTQGTDFDSSDNTCFTVNKDKLTVDYVTSEVTYTKVKSTKKEADEVEETVAPEKEEPVAPAEEEEGDEAPAEAEWVGATEGAGTPEITPYILTESNNTVRLVSEPGKEDENPMNLVYDIDVTKIYGFRTYIQVEKNAWEAWHGGKVGTNSALGGWNEKYEYSTGAESPELTIDIDEGIIEFVDDSPLFDDAEQDQGGYAQIWFQNWNGDNLKVIGYDLLDQDGNVISFDEPEEKEEETPAPATGNVDAATDSSKGSPDTGVADVAAVAGIGVLAAGAAIIAKKRK